MPRDLATALGSRLASAGAAHDQLYRKDHAVDRFGRLAAQDALEEQVRRHLAELVDGLTNYGERRLQNIRHFEVVKTRHCYLLGDVNP